MNVKIRKNPENTIEVRRSRKLMLINLHVRKWQLTDDLPMTLVILTYCTNHLNCYLIERHMSIGLGFDNVCAIVYLIFDEDLFKI